MSNSLWAKWVIFGKRSKTCIPVTVDTIIGQPDLWINFILEKMIENLQCDCWKQPELSHGFCKSCSKGQAHQESKWRLPLCISAHVVCTLTTRWSGYKEDAAVWIYVIHTQNHIPKIRAMLKCHLVSKVKPIDRMDKANGMSPIGLWILKLAV